ncbi:bifunctional UDP-N-acetylglucosamine diphosphorylase/glucosamine-1-phosphate N-acetyltransferase GlmU [Halobacillus litoralis]|uniref:bifunctional UDP-N-acetylglucosamine diphosphorylase/glucosamine-1-phosphate N-acetyltransferase GlmU n=1 Tax=Halobacillus litoralis TaxID=45668 RepID=UPI001CD51ADA|nr:bifunctional UDP-N-acetylglucosamine diphosphorylase/glucosamine-1-phosphate N-acetyltransferase GlmU [Halobacillus litoralis]MCA0971408.1 bifunctional UDP-N-acetylglucosamine diphosphorylase/glucosamine-1-phosphate N-acetyltransferase GlmU [Halobacillus litoralis]
MDQTFAIVLAAGKGTRMKSDLPKVLHHVCGKPMVEHVTDQLKNASVDRIVTVVGHQSERVKGQIGPSSDFAYQAEQLGTAHAVQTCSEQLADEQGATLIITGDTPLITEQTLRNVLGHHRKTKASATVLTMKPEDPTGYGRIIRDAQGEVERIVEDKDATDEERLVQEVNTGIFCFDNRLLFQTLKEISTDNEQKEYYLPDAIEILRAKGETTSAVEVLDLDEGLGINDRTQLAKAEAILQKRVIEGHMENGVTIIDPASTYIEADVEIGRDTVIEPRTHLRGKTEIGEHCIVGPDVDLLDYEAKDRTKIQNVSRTNDLSAMPYV